ncbi:MAG: hypothetical protein H6709_19055, partial [Kofleriaceae bacterium]|nr:hypothetical protein [Kofleriaceae bacterium]
MVGRALAPCAALALLACGAPAPGRPAAPVEEADAAPAPAFVIYEGDAISPLARDDGFLYWAAPDGVLRRPLGGPDAGEIAVVSRATAGLTITALVVAGDRVVCTDGGQVVAVPVVGDPDAAPVVLGDGLEPVTALAGDAGGVYAALGDTIVELRAGAEPRQVAIGQGEVTSLALDADSVWWVDHDPDPDAGDPTAPLGARITGEGAVRRAPRAGGPIAEVAGAQPSPVQVRR